MARIPKRQPVPEVTDNTLPVNDQSTCPLAMDTSLYQIRISRSPDDNAFVARCVEFPELLVVMDDEADALIEARLVLEDLVESYKEDGDALPSPVINNAYSGKTVIRMPPTLHRHLAEAAEVENQSLNQFMVTQLQACISHQNALVSLAATHRAFEYRRTDFVLTPQRVVVSVQQAVR
jgi:predicted HicB family RNase H-like nuclease